ncbi:DegV family protein with EDD domain [Psychrobacillus insolitus]|uniref:DegV family protein with EDD domain n=1 Tax=Psychrobacillus insolitus TaxID=1461 RepID=A0A2W7MSU7_9BACI|nr:DegV family protein [Psychrobacillus insolitus]PZX08274.1 DegV family protein with EDD domain [Psychrobacillus insolitus]
MKTAVVTDSTAYIPQETRDRLNIHMVPLSVVIGNDTFREEIDIDATEFYDKIRNDKVLPKTSQPPIGVFVETFERLAKEYDAVISIHLSSGISGTLDGAVQAGDMVDGIEVNTFDSEVSSMVQGFYAIRAAEMANAGAGPTEIMQELHMMKKTMRAYFMVDNLEHLHRGGRLNGLERVIGSVLQVKPILHFDNKVIVPYEKIRTRKKAMKRMVELLQADAKQHEKLQATIIHANREQEAIAWKTELEALLPNVQFTISYFGPVIGTHLGEGSMGLGWGK